LRAGPLSSPKILERLERDFVVTWVLHPDLVELGESDAEWAPIAMDLAEAYRYPVDSFVLSSQGEILADVEANEDLSELGFVRLLDAAKR
jgi:hypothetical protein